MNPEGVKIQVTFVTPLIPAHWEDSGSESPSQTQSGAAPPRPATASFGRARRGADFSSPGRHGLLTCMPNAPDPDLIPPFPPASSQRLPPGLVAEIPPSLTVES